MRCFKAGTYLLQSGSGDEEMADRPFSLFLFFFFFFFFFFLEVERSCAWIRISCVVVRLFACIYLQRQLDAGDENIHWIHTVQ